jgi:hypothetical protein
MEFKGTFKLKNLNKEAGKGISTKFRTRVKIIYLTSCAAYLGAVARQVPVLTGGSRSALLWRMNELLRAAVAIDAKVAADLNVLGLIRNIPVTMTDRKEVPHIVPKGSGNEGREKWKKRLNEEGQNENSWMSDSYVPLIIDVGVGKSYSGKYQVFFEIKDFYLENYDAGNINDSTWSWGEDFPYTIGAWNVHMDGKKAFNEMWRRLMKRSEIDLFQSKTAIRSLTGTTTVVDNDQMEVPF